MADRQVVTYAELFSSGQIKLAELSVYNWGSFHGLHRARIDPDGTLLTGDNGAGKSTLIDGLMALLLPPGRATFNVAAAQGNRHDRSLISYIRGSNSLAHDGAQTRTKSKREGAVVTALQGLYQAEDGSQTTLAALFWMTSASHALADLKRLYLVAKRNLDLEELLQAFGQGNVRALKQKLRDDPLVIACDDRFGDYQETYRRLLCMENRNAPALLSRALGLKKIDDLTTLIRDLVLEPSTVREDAHTAVAEFDDLVGTHNQLLDARQQRDALISLPEIERMLSATQSKLQQLMAEQDGLPVYIAEQSHRLWTRNITTLSQTVAEAEIELQRVQQAETDAVQRVEQRHADYLQAGGERLEIIKKDLQQAKARLTEVNQKASEYQQTARVLGLDIRLAEEPFVANQQRADATRDNLEQEKLEAQDRLIEAGAQYSELQKQHRALLDEIAEIEARPDSNVDPRFQRLRDNMTETLGIDRERLMFIGELVEVQESHRDWQGAIERAFGGLSTTLAVPEDRFSLVTRWLNQRHTGLHVRAQVVYAVQGQAAFKSDGYLRKLRWREHPYREWAKHYLAKFDLHCVATTDELDRTPFSMTQQGLMHLHQGRFDKQDQHRIDDRLNWALGFSNKARLSLLRQEAKSLEADLSACGATVTTTRSDLEAVEQRARAWEKLAAYQWQELNVPYWQGRVQAFERDLVALEGAENHLATAKAQWEAAKAALTQIQKEKERHNQHLWSSKGALDDAEKRARQAREVMQQGLTDDARSRLAKRVGELQETDLEQVQELEGRHRKAIENSRGTANERNQTAGRQAVGVMSAFRQRWEVTAADWGSDIASLADYLAHLEHLEEEGLPALVEQFKERLNRHTTQSLARLREKMYAEQEDIRDRIETINQVLARTEFRPGTHLKLGTRRERYEHVQHFDKQLMQVLSQSGSDDHVARYHQLQLVIATLEKASNPATAQNLESLRLLDPRYQMSFFAEEIDTASRQVRDVLESSSGKSGGEKESFAGTIVAASLAYVLTPDGGDKPIYCTVFLDEAFSNTAEAVSRRVLRVFRELKIHVNLITPYKNLNLARESAHSLLIVERDPNQHESQLCEVTWEEIDRLDMQRMATLQAEAAELGIEMESMR
jgi:uncharacterized protein YPO0396